MKLSILLVDIKCITLKRITNINTVKLYKSSYISFLRLSVFLESYAYLG